jgi:hypothetical protein
MFCPVTKFSLIKLAFSKDCPQYTETLRVVTRVKFRSRPVLVSERFPWMVHRQESPLDVLREPTVVLSVRLNVSGLKTVCEPHFVELLFCKQ